MAGKFCPQPENPKQHAPEAGAGTLGLPPPPAPEQLPQSGAPKSTEFDLRGQGEEAPPAQRGSESTRVQHSGLPPQSEEVSRAEEAREREKVRINKMLETRRLNKDLTPEQRYQKGLEAVAQK